MENGKANTHLVRSMNILSLFDGISCARVALERVGIPITKYYASEIDKNAIAVAMKNYPDTIQLGDVRGIHGNDNLKQPKYLFIGKIEKQTILHTNGIDLLVGGSPCQDLSIAQKNRKGLDGERSGLFWEYVRILKEVKPKWFILENVSSMSKEAKEIITKELGVEPIMINAALVSAQNRKRLFWTNIPNVVLPEDRGIFLKDILEENVDESFYAKMASGGNSINRTTNFVVKPKSNTIRSSGRGSGIDNKHNWGTIRIGSINKGGQGDRIYSPEGKSVRLSALGGGRGAKTGLYIVQTPRGKNTGGKRALNGKVPTLSSSSWEHNNKLSENEMIRKLTPVECERLQSLPDDYTDGVSNTQRYKALGNAFNVEVVAHILKSIAN